MEKRRRITEACLRVAAAADANPKARSVSDLRVVTTLADRDVAERRLTAAGQDAYEQR